jgi:hypothetical protein
MVRKQASQSWFLQKYPYMLAALLLLGIGFWSGFVTKKTAVPAPTQALREFTNKYQFIHPLLVVNRTDISVPSPVFASLADSVKSFITKQQVSGSLDTASVFFIDYGKKSGSFAINEKESYAPASLLKVVIMVAYLKKADTDPSSLEKRLTYAPSVAQGLELVPFETPSNLSIGKSYSVSDLIDAMITKSDNGAMNLLADNIEDSYLNGVYADLGLKAPKEGTTFTISAEDYSLFFRILFNGTYLSDANSEKALSILSKAVFADGLVAGLPKDTVVAHKFGEHINNAGEQVTSIELHDCGFVYVNQGPYLLCVMTRGKSLEGVQNTISGISKLVYSSL